MNRFKTLALAGAAALSLIAGVATSASAGTAPTRVGHVAAGVATPNNLPTETGPYYICANGGSGLCLQNNGGPSTLVANDNKIGGAPAKQIYYLQVEGTTKHSTSTSVGYPFTHAALNNMIAPGRNVYLIGTAYSTQECLYQDTGITVTLSGCANTTGDYWVASGSGRLINVANSDDGGNLAFLNSTGVNGGNPELLFGANACPAACWSNVG